MNNNNNNNVTVHRLGMEMANSINHTIRWVLRWAIIAILLNIAASMDPELPKQFPVIFEFANGTLRVANLIIKWLMELLYSIKELHFFRFLHHWWSEVWENVKIFLNWIRTTGKWW